MITTEIYLTKKNVSEIEWKNFIETISEYNGLFNKWKLIVVNDRNKIRYFIKTKCLLPATINQHSSFILKRFKTVKLPDISISLPYFAKKEESFVDFINLCEVKNKGKLNYLEIDFFSLVDHTKSNI